MAATAPLASPPAAPQVLTRQLSMLDAACCVAGIILGSGIFVAPAALAPLVDGPLAAATLWVGGALIALCGALCYAECGARLPRDGGFFIFYEVAFGRTVARLCGWAALGITYPASLAGVALVGARYAGEALPALRGHEATAAAAMLACSAVLNGLGVRLGALTQRALTGAKVLALVALCVAALVAGHGAAAPAVTAAAPAAGSPGIGVAALLAAFATLMWTYDGWTDVTLLAGEIRDPGRNLARAACLGLGILAAVYVLVQLAVGTLLSPAQAAASPRVLAEATGVALGPAAGDAVAWLVVLSTAGSVHGLTMTTSRLVYAMAQEGALPRALARVAPRLGTPAMAIAAVLGAGLVYLLGNSFEQLVSLFSLAIWLFYGLTAVALWRLRAMRVGEPLAWRTPLGRLAPAVLVAVAGLMTVLQGIESPRRLLLLVLALAVGAVEARRRTAQALAPADLL